MSKDIADPQDGNYRFCQCNECKRIRIEDATAAEITTLRARLSAAEARSDASESLKAGYIEEFANARARVGELEAGLRRFARCQGHAEAAVLLALLAGEATGATSSIEYHQKRGAAWDIIDQALNEYDQHMLDDDYEGYAVLHKIMKQMRERKALYDGQPAP